MRIALIAAVRTTPAGELRAELQLAGRAVLFWQAETMLELGCERFLCLCEGSSETILSVQRLVEAAGAEFHVIRGVNQIAALARPQDQIAMLRDGLLVDPNLLASGQSHEPGTIVTIPAMHRLVETHPDDFERIDRERNWAGFAFISGDRMADLSDYPADSEAMSLLLRLGLQGQARCEPLDETALGSRQWLLASDKNLIEEHEANLISSNLPPVTSFAPGAMVARFAAKAIPPSGLARGHKAFIAAGLILAFAAIALVWFDYATIGLVTAAIAAVLIEASALLHALRHALYHRLNTSLVDGISVPLVAVLSGIAVVLAVLLTGRDLVLGTIPVMSLGLAFHLAGSASGHARGLFGDRALHLIVFAIAASTGILVEAIAVFGLIALSQLMLQGRQQ